MLSNRAEDVAYKKAVKNVESYKYKLNLDPFYVYREVDNLELTRICYNNNNSYNKNNFEAGEIWPGECGATWGYVEENSNDYIKITPPNKDGGMLTITSFVKTAGKKIGYEEKLKSNGYNFSVITESNLPVIRKGTGYLSFESDAIINGSASLGGNTYSNGKNIIVNDNNNTEISENIIFSNNELFPTFSEMFFNQGDLRSRFSYIEKIGCINENEMVNFNLLSSDLCIKSGRILRDYENNPITVPLTIDKILILPEKNSNNRVEIYYANYNVSFSENCSQENCSLRAESFNSNSNPGKISNWSYLGSFNIPSSGIIYSEHDLYIGNCGESAFTNVGNCDTIDDIATSGIEPDNKYIFIAGSIYRPKDIYISGPINEGSGSISLFSSGSIFIPYFASASSNLLKINADIISLGYNEYLIASIPKKDLTNINNKIINVEIKGQLILGPGNTNIDNITNLSYISKLGNNSFVGSTLLWRAVERRKIVD